MLQKIADFYEDEVDTAVANLTSLIEPLVMVFLGVVIGGLVISMYLPIFKLGSVLAGHAARTRRRSAGAGCDGSADGVARPLDAALRRRLGWFLLVRLRSSRAFLGVRGLRSTRAAAGRRCPIRGSA